MLDSEWQLVCLNHKYTDGNYGEHEHVWNYGPLNTFPPGEAPAPQLHVESLTFSTASVWISSSWKHLYLIF